MLLLTEVVMYFAFGCILPCQHSTFRTSLVTWFLVFLGTITKEFENKQVLDNLKVERERGITIKAQVGEQSSITLDTVLLARLDEL